MKEIKNNAPSDTGTITFLSLFLLLLAFFILLNVLSTIEETKTREVLTSVAATFRSVVDSDTQTQILVSDLGPTPEAHEILDALEKLWVTSVPITRVDRLTGGQIMRLTFPVNELFLGGQAVLRADRDELIDNTALVLARKPGTTVTEAEIVFGVEAQPEMLSSRAAQLTAERAGKVAVAFIEHGTPAERLSVGLRDGDAKLMQVRFEIRDANRSQVTFSNGDGR
jgi:hypothetical protein